MDNKLKIPLSIVLGGYIFSIGFCFFWYWLNGFSFLNPTRSIVFYVLDIAIIIFPITVIYFFISLLIWSARSLQNLWTTFFLVSIITLLTSTLIPYSYYASYQIERAKEKGISSIVFDRGGNIPDLRPSRTSQRGGLSLSAPARNSRMAVPAGDNCPGSAVQLSPYRGKRL
ncbi:MAG: hypothetical protein P8Y37_04925 [Anaerolineales bacterium]